MPPLVLIAHNLRSAHNIGSLLRTCDGLGVKMLYLTGYSPHPAAPHDHRLPHQVAKVSKSIHKTALGAEESQPWTYVPDVSQVLTELQSHDYVIYALEQSETSLSLPNIKTDIAGQKRGIALVLGREVEGIEPEVIAQCDHVAEIPMFGKKESYNVVQAAAMALYHFRFN